MNIGIPLNTIDERLSDIYIDWRSSVGVKKGKAWQWEIDLQPMKEWFETEL